MKKYRSTYLLIVMLMVLAMIMAACGGDDAGEDEDNGGDDAEPTPTAEILPTVEMSPTDEAGAGNAGNGETLFTSLGCVGCHTAEDGTAPTLQGVALRAGERVEGMAPEDYLHQSIVEPEAYVVEEFEPIMPSYADQPEQTLNDLVAYLMTLDE